jgi:hypothetical protein
MIRTLIAASVLIVLAGCDYYGADFGDAVHSNVAAQSVQPNPPASAQPVPGNGENAQLAQQRYATDRTKRPTSTQTSSVNIGGGGDSGGGGSPAGGP